jgi:hypothetical protein
LGQGESVFVGPSGGFDRAHPGPGPGPGRERHREPGLHISRGDVQPDLDLVDREGGVQHRMEALRGEGGLDRVSGIGHRDRHPVRRVRHAGGQGAVAIRGDGGPGRAGDDPPGPFQFQDCGLVPDLYLDPLVVLVSGRICEDQQPGRHRQPLMAGD